MRTAIMLPLLLLAAPATGQRYLSGPGVALREVLPPAPTIGSPEDAADRATFRATRRFAGTRRWQQAIADTDESVPAMLANFSPSAGRTLSVMATPALAGLLTRMRGDVAAAVRAVKPIYARHRPFLADPGPVCQPKDRLKDFDYPSGHTSWGTAVSLVLAELIPNRADAILARGRDYGESRIICGAHNASAVIAAREAAAAIVARLHGDRKFANDISATRHELGRNSLGAVQ